MVLCSGLRGGGQYRPTDHYRGDGESHHHDERDVRQEGGDHQFGYPATVGREPDAAVLDREQCGRRDCEQHPGHVERDRTALPPGAVP